jgi:hypothetical protein
MLGSPSSHGSCDHELPFKLSMETSTDQPSDDSSTQVESKARRLLIHVTLVFMQLSCGDLLLGDV